jgi:predicted membrane-bound spermidine synthase
LNYPLTLFWFSVAYAIDRLPLHDPNPGLGFTALALVAGFVFLASVALFWCLVVIEIELRLQGKSLLRFSSRVWSFVTIVVLFCLGAGALISAYLDGRKQIPFMLRNGSVIGLFLGILPDIFLLAWAITLTGMAVSDFRNFIQSHSRTLSLP